MAIFTRPPRPIIHQSSSYCLYRVVCIKVLHELRGLCEGRLGFARLFHWHCYFTCVHVDYQLLKLLYLYLCPAVSGCTFLCTLMLWETMYSVMFISVFIYFYFIFIFKKRFALLFFSTFLIMYCVYDFIINKYQSPPVPYPAKVISAASFNIRHLRLYSTTLPKPIVLISLQSTFTRKWQ